MKRYEHLFFYLYHTLWDFETNAKDALHQCFSENKLAEQVVDDYEIFYERYIFHNNRLWDRYSKGFINQEELKWKRMWLTMLDFKIADEPLARKLSVEFLELLPLRKKVFPYTFEILHYLKNKNYHLHLITNGFNHVQESKVQNAGLAGFFEHLITSEASGSLKPNKEIFEFALNQANAKTEQSIMIGDNPETDIKGAQNAGLDTVFANYPKTKTDIKPTFEITDLKQLEGIF
jgi:putative hydrolase of the HAD superfamily